MFKNYIDRGLCVIPESKKSHNPAIKNYSDYHSTLPELEEALTWSLDTHNMGLVTGAVSGIIALDLDCIDQRILDLILPMIPPSPVEKVGSKGFTRFFRYNGEVNETVSAFDNVVIEVLSDRKKTTIPPSIHPKTGIPYKWTDKGILDVDVATLPALPRLLLSEIRRKIVTAFPTAMDTKGKIQCGRNNNMSSFVASLIADRIDLNTALSQMLLKDREVNEKPLFSDTEEFRQPEAMINALTFYSNHLNSINIQRYREGKSAEIPAISMCTEVEKTEKNESFELILPKPQEGSTLQLITDHILERSFVKQPAFALSAALSLMGIILGRKFIFENETTNLYIMNVANSGAGKDAPQKLIKDLLTKIGAKDLLGCGDYVSDASLMEGLEMQPKRLDVIDEASKLFARVDAGSNGHDTKMADILCELFTSANNYYAGRRTAERQRGACERPCVSILASTTPRGLEDSLSRKSIEKGLLGRFLLFEGDSKANAKRVKKFLNTNPVLVAQLRNLHEYEAPEVDRDGLVQRINYVESTKEADRMLDTYFNEFDNMRVSADRNSLLLPIISRLYQIMLKIALIHAAARTEPINIKVDVVDVEFAKSVSMYYYYFIKKSIEDHIFENKIHKNKEKVYQLIRDKEAVSKQVLTKNTKFLTARDRTSILDDLIAEGKITIKENKWVVV